MTDKITKIFFYIDEFCKEFYKVMEGQETAKKKRNKPCKLSDSEQRFHITGLLSYSRKYCPQWLFS